MSAFRVSSNHLAALVAVYLRGARDSVNWRQFIALPSHLERLEAERVARMLADENCASVSYRYGEPLAPLSDGEIARIADAAIALPFSHRPSTVEAAKLLACLDYQSCEHDDWETSEAFRWIKTLRGGLLAALPGYASAEWTI